MKPQHLITLALLAATGLAQAAPAQRVEIRGRTIDSATAARGEYQLADGRRLALHARGARLVAQIDAQAPMLLQPAAGDNWASADGSLRVQLHAAANGSVHRVTVQQQR
jgi:hypothetical protein